MLHPIDQWIDQTNLEYQERRICCSKFVDEFKGFYSPEFLQQAYFVIVDKIPKPNFPELRQMGLGGFIDMELHGITYKDTYYVLTHLASDLGLHFHELVHVAQWRHLGAIPFMKRYITEIQTSGYHGSSLEKMAYGLDSHFRAGGEKIDVPIYVAQKM
ncbi:hypothetical protein [Vibrio sp. H11]|uniref:hypothetical protein n=1 Tax=Vibrio sp. H11 TaxID=2565928 RepID=UPI0010A60387|nr:hypothetical protein [Vibrio sp. H11]